MVIVSVDLAMANGPARIDLNTATMEQLQTLPGIGEKRAALIVARRTKAPFTRPSQLLLIKGIGPKILSRLEPRIFVAKHPM
jgi:competence ComEA-like helix-hairpin-helix protein